MQEEGQFFMIITPKFSPGQWTHECLVPLSIVPGEQDLSPLHTDLPLLVSFPLHLAFGIFLPLGAVAAKSLLSLTDFSNDLLMLQNVSASLTALWGICFLSFFLVLLVCLIFSAFKEVM